MPKRLQQWLSVGLLLLMSSAAQSADNCPALLDFEVRQLDAEQSVRLCEAYAGKVILVVNTASKCVFTRQYDGLEKLYAKYRDRGLVVLGFPSNDFGHQEPGNEQQIRNFCQLTYGVQFPMFAKTHVKKKYADPFYQALGKAADNFPSWNFHKYLIDRNGQLVDDYSGFTSPMSKKLQRAIERQL
ncbi:MAG: glutathione peroxidase [Chromatiales bacterium]|jgi:glutathione peroxidase